MDAASKGSDKRWDRRDTILVLLVLLLAGGLRVLRLAEPDAVVFDETYYAKDACLYLGHSQQFCGLDQATEQSYVHPPLGKWLISLGIKAFGYNSFGWRFSAAIFGTAMAGLVYALARRLFADRWIAAVAGFLTATDFLLIVQSRIAMLDIFLSFFVVLGFFCLVMDRQRTISLKDRLAVAAPPADPVAGDKAPSAAPKALGEPETDLPARKAGWRLAAGVAFGLAVSVKWSALLALAAAAVCAIFWSLELLILGRKQRSAFYGPPRAASLGRELAITFAAFFLVPLLVYSAGYSAYFVDRLGEDCPFTIPADPNRLFDAGLLRDREGRCVTGVAGVALSFGDLQDRMLDYHANLKAEHSYQSKAWTWPLVLRPVAYFYETEDATSNGESSLPLLLRPLDFLVDAHDQTATEVIALGNVVTWYGALLALVWLIPRSFQSWRPERVVLLAWGAQYLPWLLVPRPLFFFYMTPVVPFMMIGLAAAARALWQRWAAGKTAVVIYLASAVVVILLFYPVIAAVPLPEDWWRRLMWIPHFKCGDLQCGWI